MKYIVFISSFCLMLVQIVSGRALAPYVGVSVYVWTGVIGTTLLGIVFGYAAGGIMADTNGNKKTLGISLALAGLASLVSYYVLIILGQRMGAGSMPLIARVVVMSFCVFFPTAFFLSTIVPQAVKQSLSSLSKTGGTVGELSAWSAIGNLLGTFAGGYVLIPFIGTKGVMIAIAAVLMLLGLWVARGEKLWRNKFGILAVAFFIGAFILPGGCIMETNYFCIRIASSQNEEGAKTHILRLDHLVHSYVNPANPRDLGYDYEQVYANLIASRFTTSTAFTAYFIGGGGYVLPRYIEAEYPQATSIVAEIDPGVTEANHRYMGLDRQTRIITANEDARMHLMRGGDASYDLVFGDAFNDFSVPYHLTTVEFHKLLKSRMSADGVYALNIIDDARYGEFLAAMVRTLREVWTNVYVAPQADTVQPGRNTIVLIASDRAIDQVAWYGTLSPAAVEKNLADDARQTQIRLINPDRITELLDRKKAPALRDDYVPTDRYLAPVFSDAY
ncbi:fused MFS/spermidine synthase [Patescibacteria group bacterium]|jgi:spermidine synthase|nr:fused MFS/spermidine synthase [Patescibacteria group bacterium]